MLVSLSGCTAGSPVIVQPGQGYTGIAASGLTASSPSAAGLTVQALKSPAAKPPSGSWQFDGRHQRKALAYRPQRCGRYASSTVPFAQAVLDTSSSWRGLSRSSNSRRCPCQLRRVIGEIPAVAEKLGAVFADDGVEGNLIDQRYYFPPRTLLSPLFAGTASVVRGTYGRKACLCQPNGGDARYFSRPSSISATPSLRSCAGPSPSMPSR